MRLLYSLLVCCFLSIHDKESNTYEAPSIRVPHYAKMTDSVFNVGDLIQHNYEFRHALGPNYATRTEKAGIHASDSVRYKHFLELVDFIKTHPELILEIGTHCDYRGNAQLIIKLTQVRAENIVQVLTQEFGIDSTQIAAKGYGRENPRTIYICNGQEYLYVDDPQLQACDESPQAIVLTNEYINSFNNFKVAFERLHQFNRRTEVKVIGIRE